MTDSEKIKQIEHEFQIIQKQCLLNNFYEQKGQQEAISFCESFLSKCLFLVVQAKKSKLLCNETEKNNYLIAQEFKVAFFQGYRNIDLQKMRFEYPLEREEGSLAVKLKKENRDEVKMNLPTIDELFSLFKDVRHILEQRYSYFITAQKVRELFLLYGISF